MATSFATFGTKRSDTLQCGFSWKLVWTGIAPLKVEIFCWQVLKGRVAVKDEQVKRSSLEFLDLLVFIRNLSWVMPIDSKMAFLVWQSALPKGSCDKLWKLAFFAIIWLVWLFWNDVVFNSKRVNIDQLMDMIKSWYQMDQPPMGMLKFNVDGASLGKPGPVGIGAILRDHLERQRIIFSKDVRVVDSNIAEYLVSMKDDVLSTLLDDVSRIECWNAYLILGVAVGPTNFETPQSLPSLAACPDGTQCNAYPAQLEIVHPKPRSTAPIGGLGAPQEIFQI
ncbi:hypothetical protein DITRI_Ditri06bG0124600 [Diplodiscus trichospermus]